MKLLYQGKSFMQRQKAERGAFRGCFSKILRSKQSFKSNRIYRGFNITANKCHRGHCNMLLYRNYLHGTWFWDESVFCLRFHRC